MKKFFVLLFTTFCIINLQAQTTDCPTPDEDLVYALCSAVKAARKEEVKKEKYEYAYEKYLDELACVHPNDTPEEQVRKVRAMWDKYKLMFACDVPAFRVNNGNILKLSIDAPFTEFVKQMLRKYALNVDFVDPSDGKTLLQFINDEIKVAERSGQTSKAAELKEISGIIESYKGRKGEIIISLRNILKHIVAKGNAALTNTEADIYDIGEHGWRVEYSWKHPNGESSLSSDIMWKYLIDVRKEKSTTDGLSKLTLIFSEEQKYGINNKDYTGWTFKKSKEVPIMVTTSDADKTANEFLELAKLYRE